MTLNNKYNITHQIVNTQSAGEYTAAEIGGKAAQLKQLSANGYSIPEYLVLPHAFLKHTLKNEDINWSELQQQIENQFATETIFAVRSSANLEDGQQHSFAGLFTTVLGVHSNDLAKAIQEVYASGNSQQVIEYCKVHQIDSAKIELSVIVQILIPAEKSGVAFGVHPLTGERQCAYIEAISGFGEGLVSGKISADIYTLGKTNSEQITTQSEAFQIDMTGTVICGNLKKPRVEAVLNFHQRIKVKDLLFQLQTDFGKYLDIEFAFAKNKLYLLQARPITTLSADATCEDQLLWDNSNIIESYPGFTLPLTFSFISKVYASVYKELAKVMGMSTKHIKEEEQAFQLMLGLIHGRVYYNLYNWYGLLALLPGYSINAPFMEKMMGVKEKLQIAPPKMNRWKAWGSIVWSTLQMLVNLFTLNKQVRRFHQFIDQYILGAREVNLSTLSAAGILKQYNQTEKVLARKWQPPLLNDFFTMIFFGSLEKMCKRYFPDEQNLHNELLAGSHDIISTAPFKKLIEICNHIRSDEKLIEIFDQEDLAAIAKEITTTTVQPLISNYIEQFGDRTSEELKLETITYRENPLLLIQRIKALLASGDFSLAHVKSDKREKAEAKVKAGLKNPLKRRLFFTVLKRARTLVSGRENLRFERTRVFALIRSYFLALGKLWEKEGLLHHHRDVFYLGIEEIKSFVFGTASISSLKTLVENQKAQYEQYMEGETPADRCRSYDSVNQFFPTNAAPSSKVNSGDIKGLGCSTGVVRAKVIVVEDPTKVNALNGEILVARFTDPGWVTLFPGASGILVERGSLLSHSAIVSREIGLPCIVQIDGLMDHLKTGDLIEMDGATGNIQKLNA